MLNVTILGSGSDGNCMVLRFGDHSLMIDAGFSGVEIKRRMMDAAIPPDSIRGLLVTHEHADHIKGLRVFADRHTDAPVYTNALTAERLRYKENAPERLSIFANGAPFDVGPFRVDAFSICHDAVDPVGFIVHAGGCRIGIATDFGHPGAAVPFKLKDCEAIILESNHDPELLRQSRRPIRLQNRILSRRGHLSNQLAAQLVPNIVGSRTRHLILAHLSEECNRPRLVHDLMAGRLAEMERGDVEMIVAEQHRISRTIEIDTTYSYAAT